MSSEKTIRNETLMSVRDVAKWLSVRPAKVYEMEQNGTGPRSVRIGKLIKFRRATVQEWLEGNET